MTETVESARQKSDASKKQGYQDWVDQPLVRLAISQIPQATQKEALDTLLRSAFDAGHAAGQGVVLISLVEHMFEERKRR